MYERLRQAELGKVGYRPLRRDDLLKDILREQSEYEAEHLLDHTLPTMARGNTVFPCFRYLANAGRIFIEGRWTPDLAPELDRYVRSTQQRLQPTGQGYASYRRQAELLAAEGTYFRGLSNSGEGLSVGRTLLVGCFFPLETYDTEQLRQFLIEHFDEFIVNGHSFNRTPFARLACIYDLLRFSGETGFSFRYGAEAPPEEAGEPE